MIQHACSGCGGMVRYPDDMAGLPTRCPRCGTPTELPEASAGSAGMEPPALLPTRPRRRWLSWLGRGLILALAGALAWLLNGSRVWEVIAYFAAMALALWWLWDVCFWWGGRRFSPVPVGYWSAAALALSPVGYWSAVLAVWLAAGWLLAYGTVHIDNESKRALVVELDGREWVRCRPRSSVVRQLFWGTRRITVRPAEGGAALQELTVTVHRKVYVLNLLGAQSYYRGEVRYGDGVDLAAPAFPPPARAFNDEWFEADADYVFESPPNGIRVRSRGLRQVRRTYLRRGAP
jgi:hypothetical protein